MKTSPVLAVLAVCVLTLSEAAPAEDYQGADAILKQVQEQLASTGDGAGKLDPLPQWRADIKSYQRRAASLTPDQAAHDWLALFDRACKLPPSPGQLPYLTPASSPLQEVFSVLPPPTAWDALAAQVVARPLPDKGSTDFGAVSLRIVAGTLQDQPDAVRQAIEALKAQVDGLDQQRRSSYLPMLDGLQDAFLTLGGDKQGALASFEGKVVWLAHEQGEMQGTNSLDVPNLADLTDAPRAEALLKQALALPLQSITFTGEKTRALARKVALEMGDKLKCAPWSLVDTLDSTSLYDLLAEHFPATPQDQSERRHADAYDLLGLISQQRYDEATRQAVKLTQNPLPGEQDALASLPEGALSDMAGKGYAEEVYQFFGRFLAVHPELPYWQSYTDAAVLAGKTDAMLAQVKAASERADLPPHEKSKLDAAYGEALLAAGRTAEALPILRAGLAATRPAAGEGGADRGALESWAQATVKLAAVGELLNDQHLVNEQLDALAGAAQTQPAIMSSVDLPWGGNVVELYLAAGRGPELERLLTANLLHAERSTAQQLAQMMAAPMAGPFLAQSDYYFQSSRTALYALTDLYYQAGRYGDIVALLDRAKYWGVDDVGKLVEARYSNFFFGNQAARALQKTGDNAAALQVVNAYLERNSGSDPAYALLLELLPPDQAEARLNTLFQGDQFEERPLIWRAVLQLGQGRLDEAEKSARQAISIDPSDGEEGRGDRMRAYAVLGDILERKGQPDKAAPMRAAVQAIRLSEDADRFHAAGLLTPAVGMYEKALGYFADAYCIQSRLAIQLVALGKLAEAMPHYERAYELMPESFGRMESHCFGCERAFAGERAQSVAESVFEKFVQQQPANPRVHYLLGYLRMEEDRNAEAAREFQAAVKLDPDYINAWKQLASNTDDPAVRDEAELNLLRLDPRREHDSVDLGNISNLRALWVEVEAAEKFALPEAAAIYPLAASKAMLDEGRQRHPQPSQPVDYQVAASAAYPVDDRGQLLTPRAAILQNKVIAAALLLAGTADFETTE